VGTHSTPHRACSCTAVQHKMLQRYWKGGGREAKQHSFIFFTFSLLFHILQTAISVFCVLLTIACILLRNRGFSAQFCVSALGLFVGGITVSSAATTACPSFSLTQCVQLAHLSTGISIPLNSHWCLLCSARMQKGQTVILGDRIPLIFSQHTVIKINSSTARLVWERLSVVNDGIYADGNENYFIF